MKLRLLFAIMLLFAAPVLVHGGHMDDLTGDIDQEDLEIVKNVYNNHSDELPSLIRTMVGNENINVILEESDFSLHVYTEGGKIVDIGTGVIEDPTLIITIDHEAQEKITNDDFNVSELKNLYVDDNITIESVGFWSNIKMGVFKGALFVTGLF